MIHSNLAPVVQKYGGSSLASTEKLHAVARKIATAARSGRPHVVVVSAMGGTTTELLERAREVATVPPRRELDVLLSSGERMSMSLLAMAIEDLGQPAVSLSGPQCGILTDDTHTNAEILRIRPERILEELGAGQVVIVAGYQGANRYGDVTTLGRGGSDTTAVALAGALDACRCEIYSDVPGVYSADPRIVPKPRHLPRVDARLMGEYARHGARVLHPASIELAHAHGVPVHACSTFDTALHTVIAGPDAQEPPALPESSAECLGVTSRRSRIRLLERDGGTPRFDEVLGSLAGRVDVLQGVVGPRRDCLLDLDDVPDAASILDRLRREAKGVATLTDKLASVSLVAREPRIGEIRDRVGAVLEDRGVSVAATYVRPLSITCAVDARAHGDAVRALHDSLIEAPLTLGT